METKDVSFTEPRIIGLRAYCTERVCVWGRHVERGEKERRREREKQRDGLLHQRFSFCFPFLLFSFWRLFPLLLICRFFLVLFRSLLSNTLTLCDRQWVARKWGNLHGKRTRKGRAIDLFFSFFVPFLFSALHIALRRLCKFTYTLVRHLSWFRHGQKGRNSGWCGEERAKGK